MVAKYKSFAITVRPRDGVEQLSALEKDVVSWFKKQTNALVVAEDSGSARHIHGQIWLETERSRGEVVRAFDRIMSRNTLYDNAQKKIMRNGVKIAYSDWFEDYLLDNDEKETNQKKGITLFKNIPENTYDFYPTEAEQEEIKEKSNASDTRFYELEQEFLKHVGDKDFMLIDVANFLAYKTNVARTMRVITDKRVRTGLCRALFHYMRRSTSGLEWLTEGEIDQIKLQLSDGLYEMIEF
jgi:hypothetical protein